MNSIGLKVRTSSHISCRFSHFNYVSLNEVLNLAKLSFVHL